MKNFLKFLGTAIIMIAFTVSAYGQSSIVATATATILTPISITKNADLNFGNLAGSSTAGTIDLSTLGAVTATGGVTILGGAPTAASFDVDGVTGAAFTFSVPASIVLTSVALDVMTVDTFVDDAPATIVGGSVTISLGATLHVLADQPAGVYTNAANLVATVNYN